MPISFHIKVSKKIQDGIKLIPSKRKHFKRNKKNTNCPKTKKEAEENGSGFKKYKYWKSICHQFSAPKWKPNLKYVSTDLRREVVFNNKGTKVVKNPRDLGTYNYGVTEWEHFWKDIVPWLKWGNTPSDSTKWYQRLDAFTFHIPSYITKGVIKEILIHG